MPTMFTTIILESLFSWLFYLNSIFLQNRFVTKNLNFQVYEKLNSNPKTNNLIRFWSTTFFYFHKIYLSSSYNKIDRSRMERITRADSFSSVILPAYPIFRRNTSSLNRKRKSLRTKNNFLPKDPQSSTKTFFHKNVLRLKRIIFKPTPFCWMRVSSASDPRFLGYTSSPFNFFQMMYQCWWNNLRVLFSMTFVLGICSTQFFSWDQLRSPKVFFETGRPFYLIALNHINGAWLCFR